MSKCRMGKGDKEERDASRKWATLVTSTIYMIGAFGFVGSVIVATNVGATLFGFEMLGCGVASRLAANGGSRLEAKFTADMDPEAKHNAEHVLITVLVFSLAYMNAALLLVCAAAARHSFLAYPWLICEIFTFSLLLGAILCPTDFPGTGIFVNSGDTWTNIMLIVWTAYMIVVVVFALAVWNRDRRIRKEGLVRSKCHLIFLTGRRGMCNEA